FTIALAALAAMTGATMTPGSATAQASDKVTVEAGGSGASMEAQAAFNAGNFATARAKYELGCFTDGNGAGCNNLGAMAFKGQGGAKDLPLARRAYRQGCAKSIAKSCEVYGSMLKSGSGGAPDPAGAIAPLTAACNARLANACYDLG